MAHQPINFTLDGKTLTTTHGKTIWEAAHDNGVEIPNLCRCDGLQPDGNCRACVVEIKGERALAASCKHHAHEGMQVTLDSERVRVAQRTVVEMLAAKMPPQSGKADDELKYWVDRLNTDSSRFTRTRTGSQAQAAQWATTPPPDTSHPAIHVHFDACIQCGRCVRACREVQFNDVLGLAGRGEATRIVFDQGVLLSDSSCVACGECVAVCPTGALRLASGGDAKPTTKTVDSVCPYCGVGCALTYHLQPDEQGVERIVRVEGRDGPSNAGRLCVKGRFGFDYVDDPNRLTVPLIRKDGVSKHPDHVGTSHWRDLFREATWEEALAAAADGLLRIKALHGGQALAGLGSAKGTNEEAYLFQKLVRVGFGTNNVDHCTRLCHASSVAALLEGIGSGSVSNPIKDVLHSDVVFLIGANPTVNHPVGATWIKESIHRGARLILADPRRTDLSRKAWKNMQFKPGTDLALINAMLHVVFDEGLVNQESVAQRCRIEEVEALREHVRAYSPEAMEEVCGVSAKDIREATRAYANAKNAMLFWGMGVAQHVHGTDNVRALIALCQITGQIGRPGTGLHPLRGQNNVQGASDSGLLPFMYPDYVRVSHPGASSRVESHWGLDAGSLSSQPGLTVVEIMDAAYDGRIRGMYIEGENPAMSDPNANHVRQALAKLDHLVVQDIFFTETAVFADVILPASAWPEKTGTVTNTDRLVQMGVKAVASPGQARADLWIIQEMSRRLGVPITREVDRNGGIEGVRDVYEEMRGLSKSLAGISWDRLVRERSVVHPCRAEDEPGESILFTQNYPTADGKARLVPAQVSFAAEQIDHDYPYVLITGRQLEHWHTGSMTRHTRVLDALEPVASASLNPQTAANLGIHAGEHVRIKSRRGEIVIAVRIDPGVRDGVVFIPFAYVEAAANLLTNDALDPAAKIAEVKYCAVQIEKVGEASL
jgi:formate dehydrogenase major subunit